MDLLSPLLQHLDLETRLFHREDHCGRWTIAGPFERKAMFHLVARGRCLLRSALRPDGQALTAGDVALFLRPATHEVVPHPEATASEETTLLCGYLEFGSGLAELLLAGLPEELVLSASHSLTRGASGVLALMLDEAARDRAFRRVFGQSPGAVRRKPPTAESLTPRSRRASRDP